MAHRLVKQAIVTNVSAIQEVVGRPAYTEVTYVKTLVTRYAGGSANSAPRPIYGTVTDELGRKTQGIIGYTSAATGTPYTTYVDLPYYTYHPAINGVAGRDAAVVTDNQLGWNAGAQSADRVDGDFTMECVLPKGAIGVLVGLQAFDARSASFGLIEHGFMLTATEGLAVVESGIQVASAGVPAQDVPVTISRTGGIVTYRSGAYARTSDKPSSGQKVMAAVLYSAGDYVDQPAIGTAVGLSSVDGWSWGDGSGLVELHASSAWEWGGTATIGDGSAFLSFDIGFRATETDLGSSSMVMAEPSIAATAGFIDVQASGFVVDLPVAMAATGITVDIGTSQMIIDPMLKSADYDYGDAAMSIDDISLFALSTEEPEGFHSAAEAAFIGDNYIVDPVLYAILNERLQVGSSIELLLQMDAVLADYLGVSSESSAVSIILALIQSRIMVSDSSANIIRALYDYNGSVSGGITDKYLDSLQYATNLGSGAVGRYLGFDFDGFVRVGMDTYGFKKDGLYKIGAATDNGEMISAMIDFAAEDFGSAQGKRVGNVFLGVGTDGQVFVKTTEDGDQQMVYRAYQRRAEYRADMQRGRASRFWRLRLEIVDASFLEVDNIEWVVTPSGRRTS